MWKRLARIYFRNRAVRDIAVVLLSPRTRRNLPDIAHLAFYREVVMGPVQRDEALVLFALVRALRPKTVVELGSGAGHSAFNFLRALDPDARLYSFDVDLTYAEYARIRCDHDPRFVFRHRSQDAITREDIDGRPADFVFIDAAHDFALNQATWERLMPLLSPRAIVVIHDTGGILRSQTPAGEWSLAEPARWAGDEFEHQPGERAFVNWLLEHHPEFFQIHLHSRHTQRHGMTLVQALGPAAASA